MAVYPAQVGRNRVDDNEKRVPKFGNLFFKFGQVELQIEAAVPLVVLSPDSFEDMHL